MENVNELTELLDGIQEFAEAMKSRVIEKHKEGYKGWKDCDLETLRREAAERMIRLLQDGEEKCDVGVANWLAIHWLNRQK